MEHYTDSKPIFLESQLLSVFFVHKITSDSYIVIGNYNLSVIYKCYIEYLS